ncbi:MAG TPA: hypothetical protein VF214_04640 [Edaphobacter sp.]
MTIRIATATLVLASLPVAAQTQRTGVSNPDNAAVTANDDSAPSQQPAAATGRRPLTSASSPAQKPSAAIAAPASNSDEVYGAYVPLKDAPVTKAVAVDVPPADVDGQIVTSVPEGENELREGTAIHVRMLDDLSTTTTVAGSKFSAELMEPLEKNGRVIAPIGSVMHGLVTEVRSGKRISGAAAMHLEPRDITLPDGTEYVLRAQLTDTSSNDFKVDSEGTVKRREDAKKNLAVGALATGGGAAAGAVVGGGVGALVGAGLGAGVSTYMWLKADRQATLPKDSRLVFSLTAPMELTPMKAVKRAPASTTGESE